MLTPEQIAAREGKLTASRVACLMTGDSEKITNLWKEMIQDPSYVREDLSKVWPVQLGVVTEKLNLHWYELKTGRCITRGGEVVQHPSVPWAAATLDGFDALVPAPVECKHVGGYESRTKVIGRYLPQFHWQMDVTGTRQCMLSIIEGAREPVIEVIDYDAAYGAELWQRAHQFMACVSSLTPPCAMPAVLAPVRAEKTYDMSGNNAWASDAVVWLETHRHAKNWMSAEKNIKKVVPRDAAVCSGHGIVVTRDSRGYLSLREAK